MLLHVRMTAPYQFNVYYTLQLENFLQENEYKFRMAVVHLNLVKKMNTDIPFWYGPVSRELSFITYLQNVFLRSLHDVRSQPLPKEATPSPSLIGVWPIRNLYHQRTVNFVVLRDLAAFATQLTYDIARGQIETGDNYQNTCNKL